MQHASVAARDDRINGAETRWPLVWALILAGVIAAFQIGKAPIAIPLLRHELGLSLTFASWIIGVYAVVGAIAGLPAGLVINSPGPRRSPLIRFPLIRPASFSAPFSTQRTVLLRPPLLR